VRSLGSLLLLFSLAVSLQAEETNSDVAIVLHTSQEHVYVGESFELEVVVKKRTVTDGSLSIFIKPLMRDLWLKSITDDKQIVVDKFTINRRVYTVSAQQRGSLLVAPMEVRLAYQTDEHDAWGNPKQERFWQSHYSNALTLEVEKLPGDTKLVGEFSIALEVEGREVESSRALKAEIVIEGFGNFEDILLEIPSVFGVNIFTDEHRLYEIGSDRHTRWEQTITFVGVNDFSIPSIELTYLDLRAKAVKSVVTEAVFIDVKEDQPITYEPVVEAEDDQTFRWYLLGFIGVVGFLILLLKYVKRRGSVKKVSFRDEKAVLRLLLGHRDDEGVMSIIEALEASIYEGKPDAVDVKEIKRLLKRYQS